MPTPTVNISQVLESQVSGIASNFLNEGLKALPAIGVALLAIAGLFIVFYWTARAFGWQLKRPKRPPSQKRTMIGKANKVHFEKVNNNIWTLFNRLGQSHSITRRRNPATAGFDSGFISGLPDGFLVLADDDGLDFGINDIDTFDGKDGFYADLGYAAPWTSDSGPDDAPGTQSGGFSGDFLFFTDAASFYRHYNMDYEAAYNLDEPLQQNAIDDLRERDEWMNQFFDAHAESASVNWSRLYPGYNSIDGLAQSNLDMETKAELFRHVSILNDLKEQSFSSDDMADLDIDFDGGAYDH